MHKYAKGNICIKERQPFLNYEDPKSEMITPLLDYLLEVFTEEIEQQILYYKHCITMTGGQFLSSNHFCNIGKIVLIENKQGLSGFTS